jgi:DNA-binding beta-propeller fold protein YncE
MRIGKLAFAFALLLSGTIFLSCAASPKPVDSVTPSSQVLYVITNGTVTTYSIDPDSLMATAVEQPVTLIPATALLMQFDPSPTDQFVYAVWSDGAKLQHLSVFRTDSSGVPQLPAIQVLNADFLSQFNMHPSGRFAYMLEVTRSKVGYLADIRLLHAQPHDGKLKEDPRVQGKYGPAYTWPALLYGFSTDGSKLYDTSLITSGSVFRERSIDRHTGTLGNDTEILSVRSGADVVIGKLIVAQYRSGSSASLSYTDILPDVPNPQPLVHCTVTMLSFCATATNVQLDHSGTHLFFTDPATQAVHVAAIDLAGGKITDTNNIMPMTSQTPGFAFSPDEKIVYALIKSDGSVHFYHFDQNSGSLTEGGAPLPVASGTGICPAHHY